jgi:hypothetical protein
MAQKTVIPNRTALIPFVLFAIFAGIVAYGMWKGTHPKVEPKAKL